MDADWKTYYVNEPLSQELIHMPITDFTRALMCEWLIGIIKKYNLTKTSYGNMATVIRQILQYLVDCDLLDRNIMNEIHIDRPFFFRPPRKKLIPRYSIKTRLSLYAKELRKKRLN